MTIEPVQNLWYFIKGVFDVMISNWLLSVPLAMTIIWYALDLLKKIFGLLKGENK